MSQYLLALFGDTPINDGKIFTLQEAQQPLFLDWNSNPGELYTLIIFDANAPYTHFLAINISNANITADNIIYPYIPPSPSSEHKYIIELSKQNRILNYDEVAFPSRLYENTGNRLEFSISFMVDPLLDSMNKLNIQSTSRPRGRPRKDFKDRVDRSSLSVGDGKYCSCVIQVASKQSPECLRSKDWNNGNKCYDPYAVCKASTRTTKNVQCGDHYIYENLTLEELRAAAILFGLDVPDDGDRELYLNAIYQYKDRRNLM
ncbi:PhosphatidylEthanolamine-Binding Protein (PEBP) [Orpheovirus IHUMI-LCC2]|uniref:PhosphatidylEthanolamine-Binding Protein (PEBP) n=1 Tax=Orpheovirus IHUMI-LCC2 TaxID=2023057 RepID=A0A2I2L4Q2_9VIRU|nr:PhosphatidylEthanolamine-Binding Protein (PEBP) [Orpheovirus IHUMI-LCC2]SNW62480.1 PhosphatidylEthanolamine-Binding Protein (PEBP) [Orpheovirus IHUMI-LCC2]